MEEILGWEKKPGEKDEEEKENTQLSSTSKKSWTQKEKSERRFYIFLRLLDLFKHAIVLFHIRLFKNYFYIV